MTANDVYKLLVKFRRVGFEICGRTEMQTDKQTHIQTDRLDDFIASNGGSISGGLVFFT